MDSKRIFRKLTRYHFELRHLILLVTIVFLFQIILSFIHTTSTSNLVSQTLDIYRRDSVERIADLTTGALELLLEQSLTTPIKTREGRRKLIQKFNIILSQQALQRNVDEISLIIERDGETYVIHDGEQFYDFFIEGKKVPQNLAEHEIALKWYREEKDRIRNSEQIISYLEGKKTVHTLVPFVPWGEFNGIVYMRISPDLSNLADQISIAYNETGALFSALILLGLLAMFYISSYTVQERDAVQKQLFEERAVQLRKEVAHQKEALFTKRIYHAHHKAEKVMGFINEDLRKLDHENLELIRKRVKRYANFISRVIYDMKVFDPPMHVIRNPLFNTNLNEVINFIIDNIFMRVYKISDKIRFQLDLDPNLPPVSVNEYVVWEIIEPLLQNKLDHNPQGNVTVSIRTVYNPDSNQVELLLDDDGNPFNERLLQPGKTGRIRLFEEHTTTKPEKENAGYGCYIAYENCRRCGWILEAENLPRKGARYRILIPFES